MTATGAQTELGHINQMMAGIEKHRTPLLVQMDKLGKAIFAIILAMMVALFIFSLALRDIPMGELLLSLISRGSPRYRKDCRRSSRLFCRSACRRWRASGRLFVSCRPWKPSAP